MDYIIGRGSQMATAQASRMSPEEATALFDRKLRALHPDKVLEARIAEIQREDAAARECP